MRRIAESGLAMNQVSMSQGQDDVAHGSRVRERPAKEPFDDAEPVRPGVWGPKWILDVFSGMGCRGCEHSRPA